MSSRELQATIKAQKSFIKELLDRLEGKGEQLAEEIKSDFLYVNIRGKAYKLSDVQDMLNDAYFSSLTLEQILDLAKKSIRLTSENCTMLHKLEDIAEILDNSELSQQIKRIIDREN